MQIAPDEPACLVEGLSHAWIPEPPPHTDDTQRAKCGRCQVTRVRHPSGRTTYWEPPRPLSRAQD